MARPEGAGMGEGETLAMWRFKVKGGFGETERFTALDLPLMASMLVGSSLSDSVAESVSTFVAVGGGMGDLGFGGVGFRCRSES